MKYERIVNYVVSSLWAIDPGKLTDIVSVLAERATGKTLTAEEIQARLGDRDGDPVASSGAVAVIPIHGTIAHRMSGMRDSSGGASAEGIGRQFQQALADPTVSTVLFDIDSPGGTVTGVRELADEIAAAKGQKRIVALVNGMAASAAYWIAAQADEIVSIPSGMAGSIGVFTAHQDMSAALEKEGVKVTLISAGKHKTAGNPLEPLSDEERGVIQARVDEAYSQFTKAVARGRGVPVSEVRNGYGEGRALDAKDALAAGLIDRIATVDATLKRLTGRSASAGMRANSTETVSTTTGTISHEITGTIHIPPISQADGDAGEALREDDRIRGRIL